ncbi:MAG TPA: hypothetical protein VMT95_07675 [Candidatus Binatia bacterium]|nr:hypothetical protein [Candidatus Binatia bacterium]
MAVTFTDTQWASQALDGASLADVAQTISQMVEAGKTVRRAAKLPTRRRTLRPTHRLMQHRTRPRTTTLRHPKLTTMV